MLRNKRFRALSLFTTLGMSLASFNTFADTDIFTALDDPSTAKKALMVMLRQATTPRAAIPAILIWPPAPP